MKRKDKITILEQLVRGQSLCELLDRALGAELDDYQLHVGDCLAALYGLDCSEMEHREYERYYNAVMDPILARGNDYRSKAEQIHRAIKGLMGNVAQPPLVPGTTYSISGSITAIS